MSSAVASPLYVYAVTRSETPLDPTLVGLGGEPVHTIPAGPFSAIVSPAPAARIRPKRRHLKAHQQVIHTLLSDTTPLPFAFGTVVPSPEALVDVLEQHAAAFDEQLTLVAGCAEFAVRVTWATDNLFATFLEREPVLREARDRVFATQPPLREEMVELGRLFDSLRAERREEICEMVEHALAPIARAVDMPTPVGEEVAAMAAALVPLSVPTPIDAIADRLEEALPDGLQAHVSGPSGPYSFVSLDMES